MILKTLELFENQIVQRNTGPVVPYNRPWMHEMNFNSDYSSLISHVTFPSADEDGNNNHISIAARTVPITDFQTCSLIQLVLE